jgi:hypothetical protein
MRKCLIATMTLTAALMGAACGGGGGAPAGTGGTGGSATTGNAGSGGAPTGGGGQSSQGSFEPAPVGATWEYDTTDQGDGGTVSGTKSITVEASEPVPGRAGITAVRIHTVVPGAEDQMTWQAETATAIVRYRDDIYVLGAGTGSVEEFSVYAPSKLRVETTHLTTNETYTESYTESVTKVAQGNSTSSSSKPFAWKVINGSESITVPAGTFTALHLQKSNGNSGAIDKDYWFVRGVGKVKETAASTNRVEVLRSFHLP